MFGAINNNKLNKLTAPLKTSLQEVLQQHTWMKTFEVQDKKFKWNSNKWNEKKCLEKS